MDSYSTKPSGGGFDGDPERFSQFSCCFERKVGFGTRPAENIDGRRNCSFSIVQCLELARVYHLDFRLALSKKMTAEIIEMEPMTKVFKRW